jgi:RNA polymerase sigma-54 factor
MALELRQQLKLSQQLIMTPQLQQAIKLLQLSRLELLDTIHQELETNPLLEETQEELPTEQDAELETLTTEETPFQEVQLSEKMREDFDWEGYLDEYNTSTRNGRASTAGSPNPQRWKTTWSGSLDFPTSRMRSGKSVRA